jgi:hypothetical protein
MKVWSSIRAVASSFEPLVVALLVDRRRSLNLVVIKSTKSVPFSYIVFSSNYSVGNSNRSEAEQELKRHNQRHVKHTFC